MKSKYTRLGILITLSLVILFWGLSFLKGNDIFQRKNEFHVIYDRVDGLTSSNDVILSGYKIGQVRNIRFMPDNTGRLVVTFIIDSSIELPVGTIAQIISSDIMGTRSIRLLLGDRETIHHSNDTIPGAVEQDLKEQVSMQVLPLKNKAEELLSSLDSAVTGLAFLFDDEARKNFAESFDNINQTIFNIEKTTADLQELVSLEKEGFRNILSNVENITGTFSRNSTSIENTLQNLSAFSDSLSAVPITVLGRNVQTATEHLNTVLAQFESTDNTMGSLLNDDRLYVSLNQLSANLNLLMNDIRVNPDRYLNFSAIDLGRKVYVNAPQTVSDNIVFKVHLVSSQNKLPVTADIFDGLQPVEEYEVSGAYTYLTGSTNSFDEIQQLLKLAQINFPDASVVAFRNGRLIKLERALRSGR
jgi:phospholipid/cholesterol/gamma-HCH transport system substrate-binding protein